MTIVACRWGVCTTSQNLESEWTSSPSFPVRHWLSLRYLLFILAAAKIPAVQRDYVIERNVVQSDVETVNGLKLAACQLSDRCPVSLSFPQSSIIFHGTPWVCCSAWALHQRQDLVRCQDSDCGHVQGQGRRCERLGVPVTLPLPLALLSCQVGPMVAKEKMENENKMGVAGGQNQIRKTYHTQEEWQKPMEKRQTWLWGMNS